MSFMSSCFMLGGFLSIGFAVSVTLGIIPGRLQRLNLDQALILVSCLCIGGVISILGSVC